MTSVLIIDCRPKRLAALASWLANDLKVTAFEARKRKEAPPESSRSDLVLLHISKVQAEAESGIDKLGAIVDEIVTRGGRVLGYRGGQMIDSLAAKQGPHFALFPIPVLADRVDEDLKKVIAAVTRQLPAQATLPDSWFSDTVTGFNPLLERELEILTAVLKRTTPPADTVNALQEAGIDPLSVVDLNKPVERPDDAALELRRFFFKS